jgi:hypothetical protein
MNGLKLNQTVQCKNEGKRWLTGVVTDILDGGRRTLVKVDGWPMSAEFEEIKLIEREGSTKVGTSRSEYHGVVYVKKTNKWRVERWICGERVRGGSWYDERRAAEKSDELVRKSWRNWMRGTEVLRGNAVELVVKAKGAERSYKLNFPTPVKVAPEVKPPRVRQPASARLPVRRRRVARARQPQKARPRPSRYTCLGEFDPPRPAKPRLRRIDTTPSMWCGDCVNLWRGFAHQDVSCPQCWLMNTTNAQKEVCNALPKARKPRPLSRDKVWYADPNWIWLENANTLKWDPARATKYDRKRAARALHRKRGKHQKRARDSARKFKAFRLNDALPVRHTYALFD